MTATELFTGGENQLPGILLRFFINLTALLIIIRLIYQRYQKGNEHKFSFFLMGIMIFTICILLKKVELHMGMALGLFAIFSIIRFRTINLTTKDMSYLFAVVGVSVINALFDFPHPVRGTIMVNSIVILTIFILEVSFKGNSIAGEQEKGKKDRKKDDKKKSLNTHQVFYDKLELLNPGKHEELIKDISVRTGISIEKVEIRKIDLIKGYAELDVSFQGESSAGS